MDPAVFTSTFFREAKKYVFEITNARVMRKSVMCDLTSLGYVWDKTHANWNADDWLANQEILNDVLDKSGVDISVPPTTGGLYYGGEFSARKLLNIFLAQRIGNYKAQHEKFEETTRVQYGSMLGPYLTFGFITASDILLKLWADTYPPESVTTWIKNLAKREIAYHTCYYVPNYDRFVSFPFIPEKRSPSRHLSRKFCFFLRDAVSKNSFPSLFNSHLLRLRIIELSSIVTALDSGNVRKPTTKFGMRPNANCSPAEKVCEAIEQCGANE